MWQTSSITVLSLVEIVCRMPDADEKVWYFCFVTLLNYVVCENGSAIKHCNFQNKYGATAYRKVYRCVLIFKFFYGPQNFPLGANLYENSIFSWFWWTLAHILKPQWWNLVWGCRSGLPAPRLILCCSRELNCYQKFQSLTSLRNLSLHFYNYTVPTKKAREFLA